MTNNIFDVLIVGGGIIGCAAAMALLQKSEFKILLIEAENELAAHQTGNNSGVIHSGLYYKPGSLKAKNCTDGRELLYQFCNENNIKYERCGKLVVATNNEEKERLNQLFKKGVANGLQGIKKLSADELKDYEPHVNGIEGIFVPQTGIVDYKEVTNKFAEIITSKGGIIKTNCRFLSVRKYCNELLIKTSCGEYKTKLLVNCAGLYCDKIAKACGLNPGLQIIPFRGEYYKLKKESEYLVKNLIYPVPDPQFPFLGVHFTRMIKGGVEAGPNAVLAFKREGYRRKDFSVKDVSKMLTYSGFWKMAVKYCKMGIAEYYRSLNKNAFLQSLKKLIPAINENDIVEGGTGVRAQALGPDGKLIDDFRILESDKTVHVLNAPSPAATASISIGRSIAEVIKKKFKREV